MVNEHNTMKITVEGIVNKEQGDKKDTGDKRQSQAGRSVGSTAKER